MKMEKRKAAIITGASRGIGRALSIELAKAGDLVFAVGRNEKALSDLKSIYRNNIITIVADITKESGREKIISTVKNIKIDYLVNNAGILTPLKALRKFNESELRGVFDTNIICPILLTNLLIPNLKNGKILNITTVAAEQAVENVASYNITKAAVNMWTKTLRLELNKEGILVSSVIPGEVDTDMQGDLRVAPMVDFPLATEFQKAEKENRLIPAEIVALFISWILKKTSDNEFQNDKAWNIYNLEVQKRWLPQNQVVPLPLNMDKLN